MPDVANRCLSWYSEVMTQAIPCSTTYDLWKTAAPSDDEATETVTVECGNFLDAAEEIPCGFSGEVEVSAWAAGRWTVEWSGECPKCGSPIWGEYDYDPT